jgi:hypothetical protein
MCIEKPILTFPNRMWRKRTAAIVISVIDNFFVFDCEEVFSALQLLLLLIPGTYWPNQQYVSPAWKYTSIRVYQFSETCDRFRGEGRMKTVLRMDIHIHSKPCRGEGVGKAEKIVQ